MKKTYIKPCSTPISLTPSHILAASTETYGAGGDFTPSGEDYSDTQLSEGFTFGTTFTAED